MVFRFRALLTLDPPAPGSEALRYPGGTHSLLVHVGRLGELTCDKYFPAVIALDADESLIQGERAVVTVKVTGPDAPRYLSIGQPFTIWGDCAGHGVISRRVLFDGEPS
jgi:hypothetical protein